MWILQNAKINRYEMYARIFAFIIHHAKYVSASKLHPVKNDVLTVIAVCVLNFCLFVFGITAPSGPGPPHSWGFKITHNDAPQSVWLLWMSDQSIAETSTWQHTTLTTIIHAPGGIRTHNQRRRVAADLRLWPYGHWDGHLEPYYPKCRLNILCATLCSSMVCLVLLHFK